jgi:hypothetical protein
MVDQETTIYIDDVVVTFTGSSSCIITAAVPGDVYNIGGVSNEPTTHIEFTMWDNSAYGSKGKGK